MENSINEIPSRLFARCQQLTYLLVSSFLRLSNGFEIENMKLIC